MESRGEIIIYQTQDGEASIEVKLEGDTVWLNQYQMAELFTTDRSSVTKHIKNIYKSGELFEGATRAKIARVRTEGDRQVTRHAAEVIFNRVDANKPNCAVTHFKGDMPTVAEAQVAKNYHGETEIKALNLLTSMVLEFFESQAEQQRLTTLDQFLVKMRELITLDGRPLIGSGHRGSRSKAEADRNASKSRPIETAL